MPKTKRGHHRTKRKCGPRTSWMQEGFKVVRHQGCGERMKFVDGVPIENKLPLPEGLVKNGG